MTNSKYNGRHFFVLSACRYSLHFAVSDSQISEGSVKSYLAPKLYYPFRIAVTIFRRLSVPICGLAFVRISFGAPKSTKRSRTYLQRGSFIRVVSLPSENVPAPPSPNCTLQLVSSSPVSQNFCTDAVRFPLSCHALK